MALIEPRPIGEDWQTELRDQLLAYIKKYGDANENLGNLTPQEQSALSFLDQYLQGGSSQVMTAGKEEILKNLRGEYNPETSAYYKPIISTIEQRRDLARDRLRRQMQLGGNLSSLARARLEGENDITYEGEIANLMLNLQENERNRMFSSIPYAMSYGEYEEKTPLMKAGAARTIGSIPRDLETGAINKGMSMLTGYQPSYYFPMYIPNYSSSSNSSKNKWESALNGATQGAVYGSAYGGPVGTLVGAGIGGIMGYIG